MGKAIGKRSGHIGEIVDKEYILVITGIAYRRIDCAVGEISAEFLPCACLFCETLYFHEIVGIKASGGVKNFEGLNAVSNVIALCLKRDCLRFARETRRNRPVVVLTGIVVVEGSEITGAGGGAESFVEIGIGGVHHGECQRHAGVKFIYAAEVIDNSCASAIAVDKFPLSGAGCCKRHIILETVGDFRHRFLGEVYGIPPQVYAGVCTGGLEAAYGRIVGKHESYRLHDAFVVGNILVALIDDLRRIFICLIGEERESFGEGYGGSLACSEIRKGYRGDALSGAEEFCRSTRGGSNTFIQNSHGEVESNAGFSRFGSRKRSYFHILGGEVAEALSSSLFTIPATET